VTIVLIGSKVELASLDASEHFPEGFTLITLKSVSTSPTLYADKAHKSEHEE